MNNTGSFGAAAGGATDALKKVLQQAQSGEYPISSQVTNGAATAQGSVQPPTPPTGQAPMPQGGMPMPQPTPNAPQTLDPSMGGGMPFQSPEAMMILKTLDTRMKSISKQEEAKSAPVPQPVPTPSPVQF